ncbi:Afadin and alpha-actinin-binding-domain-containing protein [Xylaria acuta]|nr:Afadin and alpha-actinin-binding-domain-containing protein [Xylaria acuta]
MIDPENLRTASLYINNQLLSRGLLRDGQTIDFANPEGSDGGLQTTMGRIMSVVNDLILRRDRDAEHRESLSSTLRTLRADYQRQTTDFGRQTERLSDTQRRVDTAEATERALRTQLKTAEQGIHKLKEEMAKMKSLVAQTRSACANEVRKRDRQIDSLKKAVADAGRVRGGARNRDIITISVTGEFGGDGDDGMGMPVGATENEGYTLSMETNGFLTELAKGLSDENEGLLALVRRTVDGLRQMSGLDRDTDSGHQQTHNIHVRDELALQPPQKSAEELAAELEATVEHLRSILTNPSFVPIEEVEIRDEAITRLRAGLETMEARWKDAVHMIDGWRRRMVSGGKSVDMEDLQMGLRLSPVRVRDVEETANVEPIKLRLSCVQEEEDEEEDAGQYQQHQDKQQEPRRFGSRSPESLRLVPASCDDVEEPEEEEDDDDESDSDSSISQDDDLDIDDPEMEEPNVQILQMSTASDSVNSSPLPEPPQISPLKDSYSSGNRGAAAVAHNNSPYRKRPVGDSITIVEENTRGLAVPAQAPTSQPASPSQIKSIKSPQPQVKGDDDALSSYTASYDSPLFGKSGERPSQNRKLFSKQPPAQSSDTEQRVKNNAAGARSLGDKNASPQPPVRTRSTRSSARKSAETSSPAASHVTKRAVVDPKIKVVSACTATSRTAATTAAISTSASTSPLPSTTTTTKNQQKRTTAEPEQRNTSAQSSSSTASSDLKRTRSTGRSPTRQPPASTSASSPSSSRLPRRPHGHAQQQQSPLNMATIAAKLAASEREADAARVRAKLRAVRRRGRRSGGTYQKEAEIGEEKQEKEEEGGVRIGEDVDPVKRDLAKSPAKERSPVKSPVKKGPRRRWSRGDVGKDELDELALGHEGGDGNHDRDCDHNQDHVGTGQIGNGSGNENENENENDNVGRGNRNEEDDDATPLRVTKRSKRAPRTGTTRKAASRRRSTLSPWELQGLITGNVGGVESPAR